MTMSPCQGNQSYQHRSPRAKCKFPMNHPQPAAITKPILLNTTHSHWCCVREGLKKMKKKLSEFSIKGREGE